MFEELRFELARQAGVPIDFGESPTTIYETSGAAERGINPSPTTIYDNCVAAELRTMGLRLIVAPPDTRKQSANAVVESLGRQYGAQLRRKSVALDHADAGRNRKGMEQGAFIAKYFGAPGDDIRATVAQLAIRFDVSSPDVPAYHFWNRLRAYAYKLPMGARIKDCDQGLLEDYLNSIVD